MPALIYCFWLTWKGVHEKVEFWFKVYRKGTSMIKISIYKGIYKGEFFNLRAEPANK